MRILSLIFCLLASSCLLYSAKTNDYPLPPANAKAELLDGGKKVLVSWDAVGPVGESGGTIDVSKVVYYIFDAFGSFYDPAIAETTETSYVFDYSDIAGQDFMAYQITAGVGDYYSRETNTNIVVVGDPATIPFVESFADGHQQQPWALDPKSGYNIAYRVGKDSDAPASQDGDNGFFYMQPSVKGEIFGILSVKVSLECEGTPTLSFYYYGTCGQVDVIVSPNAADPVTVRTIDLGHEPAAEWTLCTVDLADFKSTDFITFELLMHVGDNPDGSIVAFDNIAITAASGIRPVIGDNAPESWFTIDGRPAAQPLAPGLYIRRTPAASTKLLIK